jgi:hypothetical protein
MPGSRPAAQRRVMRPAQATRLAMTSHTGRSPPVSARSGFGSADTLRRHFARARGTTPEQYRQAFRLTAQSSDRQVPAGIGDEAGERGPLVDQWLAGEEAGSRKGSEVNPERVPATLRRFVAGALR